MFKRKQPSRYLIVGCGSAGSTHARNLLKLEAGHVLLFDIDRHKAQKLEDELHNSCACVTNHIGDADAYLVCTPVDDHDLYCLAGYSYGAHVFVEKPISDTLEGADLVIKKKPRNKALMVGHNYRFDGGLQAIQWLTSIGWIGDITGIMIYYSDSRDKTTYNWPLEDGIHFVDYCRWIGGEIEEAVIGNYEMVLKHGDFLSTIQAKTGEYMHSITVQGTDGEFVWTNGNFTGVREGKTITAEKMTDSRLEMMNSFVSCVESGTPPWLNPQDARRALEIILTPRIDKTANLKK